MLALFEHAFNSLISESVGLPIEDMDQDEKDRDEYEVLREQVNIQFPFCLSTYFRRAQP